LLAPEASLLALTNPLPDSLVTGCGALAGAKAALEAYVRELAVELGPQGHRVILLKFGTVVTPAVRYVYPPQALATLEEVHRRLIPAGRMCTLEEVARMVASMLLREEAAWFNGSTVDFTGGMMLRVLDPLLNAHRYPREPGTTGSSSTG
jgi:NAD(P)-dependent dehydrogenase (short-subunit alcohol dehydrogenase family)